MKRFISLILMLIFVFSISVIPRASAMIGEPVKVACVGDSITEAFGREDSRSYPGVLGTLLGNEYEVKNFGQGGATLLKKGDKPYTDLDLYTQSLEYKPDIVLIMLGTNDAKTNNWVDGKKDTFRDELIALINSYRALESHPIVYLMTSPTVFNNGNYNIDTEFIKEVVAIQREVAQELECPVIDMHSITADKGYYFPDNIHPNAEGYAYLARQINNVLLNNADVPNKPVNIVAKDGNKRIILLWEDGGNGGAKLLSYNVYLDGVLHSTVESTMTTIKNLTNGREYEITITAVNTKGESKHSDTVACTPTAITPKITGVEDGARYDLADGNIIVSWSTSATATLNGAEFLNESEITEEGEYTLVVTNDNVVITINFTVVDSSAIPGDIDKDGKITVADALAVLRVAAQMDVAEESEISVMDMDKDGEITVSDALAVLRIAAGMI